MVHPNVLLVLGTSLLVMLARPVDGSHSNKLLLGTWIEKYGLQPNVNDLSAESAVTRRKRSLSSSAVRCTELPASTRLVVYNAIPKCGSTNMLNLVKDHSVSKAHHVNVVTSKYMWMEETNMQNTLSTLLLETAKTKSISSGTDAFSPAAATEHGLTLKYLGGRTLWTRSFYETHFIWPNLTSAVAANGLPPDVYSFFQLMRDPVDRFVSWHYYRVYGPWDGVEVSRKEVMDSIGIVDNHIPDVDEYVAAAYGNRVGCQNDNEFNVQTRQFCGSHTDCNTICSRKALARAKQNLENEYFLVGTVEDFELTAELLEKLAPTFFAGISSALRKTNERKRVGGFRARNAAQGTKLTRGKISEFNRPDEQLYLHARMLLRLRRNKCQSVGSTLALGQALFSGDN